MRGLLKRFLKNGKSEPATSPTTRVEPTFASTKPPTATNSLDDVHPDEMFMDYDEWGSSSERMHSQGEATTNTNNIADETENLGAEPQSHEPAKEQTAVDGNSISSHTYEPETGFREDWLQAVKSDRAPRVFNLQNVSDDNGNLFIHYVAAFGSSHLLRRTLDEGWSIKKANHKGKTPFDFAVKYSNRVNANFLEILERPETPDEDQAAPTFPETGLRQDWLKLIEQSHALNVNSHQASCDILGNNYLHYAAAFGNLSLVKALITNGWLLNPVNQLGKTPYDFARHYNNQKVADFLEFLLKDQGFLTDPEAVEQPANTQRTQDPSAESNGPDATNENCCDSCGCSFNDINARTTFRFCPACGAEQETDLNVNKNYGTQNPTSDKAVDGSVLYENPKETSENDGTIEADSVLVHGYQRDGTHEEEIDPTLHEEAYRDSNQDPASSELSSTHNDYSFSSDNKRHSHDGILDTSATASDETSTHDDLDEVFFDADFDLDLTANEPSTFGPSSTAQTRFSEDTDLGLYEPNELEDWEIFLDEALEEALEPTDEYFDDEDPLEAGKIAQYASHLASSVVTYRTSDRQKTYKFFVRILGDFTSYQSFAAIERLLANGIQTDELYDIYLVKSLWSNNPRIWMERRFDRMQNTWSIQHNRKLRNSMSWRLAADLVALHSAPELENLILNDWYREWINIPLTNQYTMSGYDPSFGLYSSYLYEKRRKRNSTAL